MSHSTDKARDALVAESFPVQPDLFDVRLASSDLPFGRCDCPANVVQHCGRTTCYWSATAFPMNSSGHDDAGAGYLSQDKKDVCTHSV